METTDWLGSRNPFRQAMEESVENALGIATFTRNVLYAHQSDPNPGFGILFTETDGLYTKLVNAIGVKESSASTQIGHTKNVKLLYGDMVKYLNHFDDLIRPVFAKNTLEYNTIWGANRNRFYRGSYEQRETAVKGLSVVMSGYPALVAAAAEVLALFNELKNARQAQQGHISGTGTYSTDVFAKIEDLIIQQDRNLGWLKFYYAKLPEPQSNVNKFFDIEKIIYHYNDKIYNCNVSADGHSRVCLRTFKETDRIKIRVDGTEDVFLLLVVDSKWPLDPAKGYRAVAGTIVEKPVKDIFPDLTYRQVMALNASSALPAHFVFEIIEA